MGCMLAQESEDRVEKAIYYLSKKMLDYETRYTPLEKAMGYQEFKALLVSSLRNSGFKIRSHQISP